MNIFGHDWTFYVALLAATLVRVASSPFHSIFRSVLMTLTSLVMAVVFTDPAVAWLHLDPGIYKTAVAVLIAFTADGAMRLIILASTNPKEVIDLWKQFRGGGK